MTENKGDLISREALKKALSEPLYRSTIKDFGEVIEYTHIMNTIDNAPTVEPEITDDDLRACMKESHNLGYELAEIKFKKPQGEWIRTALYGETCYECNKCNRHQTHITKFCSNCGADMRPKPNQLRDCENCVHHSDNGCEVWECEFEKRSDL